MEQRTLERMTQWIRGLALPLVLVALALGGTEVALGAIAGAALGLGNWAMLRWFTAAVMRAGDPGRARLMILLVAKIGLVLSIAAILLRLFDATGLLLGTSTMVLGIVLGAIHSHLLGETEDATDVEGGAVLAAASEKD